MHLGIHLPCDVQGAEVLSFTNRSAHDTFDMPDMSQSTFNPNPGTIVYPMPCVDGDEICSRACSTLFLPAGIAYSL